MSIEIWTIYVMTVLALMSTPGPSQLLMLTNSSAYGFDRAIATGAGDLSANALQMLAAGLGLAALLTASSSALIIIKWLGVAYLLYLGLRLIFKAPSSADSDASERKPVSLKALYMQGFLTSAANPKAVVFFAALFPQFIQPDHAFWPQLLILSATYLVVDGCFLSAYGMGASWITKRLKGSAQIWLDRIGGGCIILAALLLSLKSVTRPQ